jgi:protease secretion system outer membrane protein
MATPAPAVAGPRILPSLYERAKVYDPAYQAALAEFQTARLQATASLFAFAPQLRYSESILEFESRNRKTLTLTQPLFSIEKIGTFRDSDARASLAMANLKIKEYDLLTRLMRTLSDFIKANESLRTNTARISTLETEAGKAKKEYELGQGTITDLRDTQVRLDQARASDLSLKARQQTAIRAIAAIVGERPSEADLRLKQKNRSLPLGSLEEATGKAIAGNYDLMNALSQLRLAELDYFKAKGSFAPEISYQIKKSQTGLGSNDSAGLQISVPLQAGDIFKTMSTASNLERAKAQVRVVETQVLQDVERFFTMLDATLNEGNIRLQAIDSAALSVVANEKSFKGGVRTRLDVLNSVQTQFQVNEDYVTTVMTMADQYVGYGIGLAWATDEIVRGLQTLLFE